MTRKKEGKNELRESEAVYKALFAGAAEGILVADLQTKQFRYANPAICRMFGYIEEEFTRLGVADIHPKESLDHVLSEFEAQARGEKTLIQLPCLRKDGALLYADINTTSIILDGHKCNVGFFTDITERKRAEEALHLFKDLVEKSSDAIGMSAPDGRHYYQNEAFNRLFGDIGDIPPATVYVDHATGKQVFDTIMGGGSWQGEVKMFKKDRTILDILLRAYAIQNQDGRVIGLVGLHTDITERKRAQEKLQVMNEELRSINEELNTSNEELQSTTEELEAANEEIRTTQEELVQKEKLAAVGQLASGVGHELRNPLGVIKNAVYYIKSKIGTADPKLAKHLDIMEREINNSNKIISDLLNFSKTRLPELIPAEINEVIEETIPVANIPENVRVNRNLASGLPKPAVDRDQIRQVFLNMILNACQAMPQGGELKISSRLHKAGLKIEGKEKDCLEIEFADTGTGIAPENLKKMFDPFFTTKAKGIGLGLAVSKGIIEKHRGAIEIKSELNQGAIFIIKLSV